MASGTPHVSPGAILHRRTGHLRRTIRPSLLAAACCLTFLSCSARPASSPGAPNPGNPAPEVSVDHIHVLILNGGGRPAINYQSHLLHVEQLLSMLDQAGVAKDRITIFSSDGDDPGDDLAVRQPAGHSSAWRLQGTALQSLLRPIRLVSSQIDGFALRPASQTALHDWFSQAADRLHPGDTLLLYVTDHGERNAEDLRNNTITLWGEHLSVSELRDLVAKLSPGVRVVTLMSQCFSGSFYGITAARADEAGLADGSVCGYFSSTASRPAYGCYPESRGRDNVGHSFHFFQGIAETGSFAAAHEQTLVTDATPDVPLRSSDLFLREQLHAEARRRGLTLRVLADEMLEVAWNDRRRWESEIRLLDRIGHAFGFFSPRSLAELESQRSRIPDISRHLRDVSRAWRATLGDANRAELNRFLTSHPQWHESLSRPRVTALPDDALGELAGDLLDALVAFTAGDPETDARLHELNRRGRDAADASFRMEVRLAAVLRMRMTLLQIAGRTFLEHHGTEEQRATYSALISCEDLRLPDTIEVAELAPPEPFPAFADDVEHATAALPAWIGIRFRAAEPEVRKRFALSPGATRVLTVFPGSPAAAAGIATGDILVGPPGAPFSADREVRWWTMLADVNAARSLQILREGKPLQVEITPGVFPMQWPSLPGPPAPGETAPPLRISEVRGDPSLAGRSHVLFFWATWCAPCRASVPALLEFAEQKGLPIVAVSDEPREQIDAYLDRGEPFPAIVAMDEYRQTFQAYGVSGTPTFVWIEDGAVRAVASGYSATKGLGLDLRP